MIYPIQKIIPFEFDEPSQLDQVFIENGQSLGPLHVYLCKGLDFTSTPFDYASADYLEDMVDFYKISSSDLSNLES